MSASAHASEAPRTIAQRVVLAVLALSAAIVIAVVSVAVTLIVTDHGAPSRASTGGALHSISDTCPMARPGQPC